MRGVVNLSKDTIKEFPYLLRSQHSIFVKTKIFLSYLKISFKLFTVNRIKPIHSENIFGFNISVFDYGALHFLFREIFIKNNYFFKPTVKDPLIFICGANIGITTIYFKWLYPKSKIVAFEPDKQSYKLFKKNIVSNAIKGVRIYNLALWDKKQRLRFYIDKKNPGWLTMSAFKKRLPKDATYVNSTTLSGFINRKVDFLKMDIEGAETKVIKELEKSGKISFINKMFIEFHKGVSRENNLESILDVLGKNNFNFLLRNEDKGNLGMQDIGIYVVKK